MALVQCIVDLHFLTNTTVQDNITNPTLQPIATDWLYLPFLLYYI